MIYCSIIVIQKIFSWPTCSPPPHTHTPPTHTHTHLPSPSLFHCRPFCPPPSFLTSGFWLPGMVMALGAGGSIPCILLPLFYRLYPAFLAYWPCPLPPPFSLSLFVFIPCTLSPPLSQLVQTRALHQQPVNKMFMHSLFFLNRNAPPPEADVTFRLVYISHGAAVCQTGPGLLCTHCAGRGRQIHTLGCVSRAKSLLEAFG